MNTLIALMLGATIAVTGTIQSPDWATPAWKESAAYIVSGEATPYMASKMLVICTMINDIENRGWCPWSLKNRWYGWRYPTEKDRLAVERAFQEGCDGIPAYIYLGNYSDYHLWKSMGFIRENYVADFYEFDHWTMVGIREKSPPKIKYLKQIKGIYWR